LINRLPVKIIGKTQPEDWIGEYTPDKVHRVTCRHLARYGPTVRSLQQTNDPAPHRPPQMCPGCGHRSAFHAIKQALSPRTDITVADIGCHTLGFLPPYEMGQLLMCMGASTLPWAAVCDLFNSERKVVAFLG
jgi:indolepyruvate ferredoxin oxidoreductase alpha subunit